MLYAIVSDIHANLQAWKAVHEDIVELGVDEIVCLGDIIGYGPDPAPVVESVIANTHHCVLGNHDAALIDKLRTDRFNRDSRRILEWTKEQLSPGAMRFLDGLPLVIGSESFVCAHADVSEPALFRYIYQPLDAKHCWESCDEQIIFVGHTHIPSINMVGEMGVPHYLPPQDLRCNQNMRYVVNVGSVGQSRDGNLDACYCVFDTDKLRIYFRRVAYDVDAHLAALAKAGVPVHPCMVEGQVANPHEQLQHMEFRPLEDDDKEASEEHKIKEGPPASHQKHSKPASTSKKKKIQTGLKRRHPQPAKRGKRSMRIAASRRKGSSFTLLLILGGIVLFGVILLVVILAYRQSREEASLLPPAVRPAFTAGTCATIFSNDRSCLQANGYSSPTNSL